MFLKLPKPTVEINSFYPFKIFLLFLGASSFVISQEIKIKQLKINNKLDHFSVAVVGKDRVFLSHNLTTKNGRPIKDRFDGFVYNLFEGELDSEGEITNIEPVKRTREGRFNMSVATFSKDGKFVYFTTNNLAVGENKLKDFKTYHLQIQRAEFKDGQWTNFTSLPFTTLDASYGHPALSPDDKTLYFVSSIDGTKGKTDIYKVSVNNHSTYGEPVRLSDEINSPRTELYPFVSADNKLYFSSNRRGGVGGYDIYVYDLNTVDENAVPEILPEPINTVGEEFSFFLMDDLKRGFISSRRYRSYGATGERSKGSDDVYYFTGF